MAESQKCWQRMYSVSKAIHLLESQTLCLPTSRVVCMIQRRREAMSACVSPKRAVFFSATSTVVFISFAYCVDPPQTRERSAASVSYGSPSGSTGG